MKGLPGIIIAAALGIIGAFCNWFYINNEAKNYAKVSFIAISENATIEIGDRLREEHFVKVDVPKAYVGELGKVAVRWDDRNTAIGRPATKSYRGREILFEHDVTGIAVQDLTDRIGADEILYHVVVDPATFIPEHYDPGDEVRFFIPQLVNNASTPGTSQGGGPGSTQTVGPFRILALGARKGKRNTAKAYNRRPVRENIVTIALKFPFDSKAKELLQVIGVGGGRGVRLIKHKPKQK